MTGTKKDIFEHLQKEILRAQGFKPPAARSAPAIIPDCMKSAFPNGIFPEAAVHEFISTDVAQAAVTSGFVSGLLSGLMQRDRVCIWIGTSITLFPPALKAFAIEPDQIIFIEVKKEKDLLWVMEEALKCEGLAAVVGEIKEISFTASRRLQLAVEKSRVTGFLLRQSPRNINTIACVSRWQIESLPSQFDSGLPGVGFPRWKVILQKIRNGKPGAWSIEWINSRFSDVKEKRILYIKEQQRKVG